MHDCSAPNFGNFLCGHLEHLCFEIDCEVIEEPGLGGNLFMVGFTVIKRFLALEMGHGHIFKSHTVFLHGLVIIKLWLLQNLRISKYFSLTQI